jgi:hypothetical protein
MIKVTVAWDCIEFVPLNGVDSIGEKINWSLKQQFLPDLFDTKILCCSDNGIS